eukprot:m.237809 g.237809  ORF g.237809 m.237809 type:complete len:190 (+) comp13201_c0_seq1:13-582(+)
MLRLCSTARTSSLLVRALRGQPRLLSTSENVAAEAPAKLMPFEEYLATKKKLAPRVYVTALPFSVLGLKVSADVFVYMHPEVFTSDPSEVPLIYGMDPMFVAGTFGFCSALVAYFAGVVVVRAVWGQLNRKTALALRMREDDFQRRILKHRTVGAKQSDDYYGDKIKSIADYRKWLREQRKNARQAQAE